MVFFRSLLLNFLCSLNTENMDCNRYIQYPAISPTTLDPYFSYVNSMTPPTTPTSTATASTIVTTTTNKFSATTAEVSEFDFESELKSVGPLVNTTIGPIEGYMMKTIKGSSIYAFEGIFYAEAPIGIHRFKSPVKKKPWAELRSAKQPGPKCLQLNISKLLQVIGSEDCLSLSIFSPVLTYGGISPDLPVVVFFHGGSYSMGSGDEYGPTYLLDEDVILVTVNFRLGVLGFMSTADLTNPGNWGLKDQSLALQWIHDNIARFGGDPKKVTLMGHESGAAMAHLHMISSKTKNYFQSVVSLSGTAMNHWSVNTPEMSRRWTMKLARLLECPYENSYNFMECIDKQNSSKLVAATIYLYEWFYFPAITFAPVIEPESLNAFLSESPEQAYVLNHVARKPFIASRIANEGHSSIFALKNYNRLSELQFNWQKLAPVFLAYDYAVANVSQITDTLTKVYFGAPSTQPSVDHLSEIFGDRKVTHGLHKSLQAHQTIAPTFSYVFTYRGVHNPGTVNGVKNNEWGAGHLEDVFMYFNASSHIHSLSENDTDYRVSNVMINMLVNFINEGDPYISEPNGNKISIWEPVGSSADLKMLQIDGDVKMISEPYKHQVLFWEDIGLSDTTPFKLTKIN